MSDQASSSSYATVLCSDKIRKFLQRGTLRDVAILNVAILNERSFPDGRKPTHTMPAQCVSYSVSVWDSTDGSNADGLWEAAAAGRVAEGVTELQSKPAAWSPTTKSFELDLLEVRSQQHQPLSTCCRLLAQTLDS